MDFNTKTFVSLEAEKLVIIKQLDKLVISITQEGIAKAKSSKNYFVYNHYSLPTEHEVSFAVGI